MITSIILAAGLSERMSLGNKLLLKKNSIPIIKITLNKIKLSLVKEIIIVLGNDAKLIQKEVHDSKIKYCINKQYNDGISTSIKKGMGLVSAKSIGAMICLGDMPYIQTSTYNKIIKAFYENHCKNIVPYFNKKKGNPVLFNNVYLKKLVNISGDFGAKNLIKQDHKNFIKFTLSDEGIIKDIDNENEYNNFVKYE